MYSQKPIPFPFQETKKKPQSVKKEPVSIKATEKPEAPHSSRKASLSPLAAFLFLELFSNQKGDDSIGSA